MDVSLEILNGTQKQINDMANIAKNIPNEKFGSKSALYFYDKFENFLFCFRSDKCETYKDILNSFVKFEKYCIENNEATPFDIELMLSQAVKMEYIGK